MVDVPSAAFRVKRWTLSAPFTRSRSVRALKRWLGAAPQPLVVRRCAPDDAIWTPAASGGLSDRPRSESIPIAPAGAPDDLVGAYIASAVDVGLEAQGLAGGASPRDQALAIGALTTATLEPLTETAAANGLKLVFERAGSGDRSVRVDGARLQMALRHLVLRALLGCAGDGAVHVAVEDLGAVVEIAVCPTRGPTGTSLNDLGDAALLLYALGAVLVAEASPGGPTCLCIVLPARPAEATEAGGAP